MSRYHVNPATGVSGVCQAEEDCPFGDPIQDHYSSSSEAQAAYEKKMTEDADHEANNFATHKKQLINSGDVSGTMIEGESNVRVSSHMKPIEDSVNYSLYVNGLAVTRKNVENRLKLDLMKEYDEALVEPTYQAILAKRK